MESAWVTESIYISLRLTVESGTGSETGHGLLNAADDGAIKLSFVSDSPYNRFQRLQRGQ